MRIAYLCADRGIPLDGVKGASIHVRAVAQALAARGHDLTLLASRPGTPLPDLTPSVVDVGFDRTLKDLKRSVAGQGGVPELGRETQALMLNARSLEALAELDREAPLDAVYERYSLWSWAGLRFCRERERPLVLEVNAPLVREQATWRRLDLAPVARAIEGEVLRGADAVVVPSAELKAWLRSEVGRRRRTWVIPNGFDEELFRSPGPLPGTERLRRRFVVAFVGTLKPWHGVEVLLAAFERLAERVAGAHLLVVGDGPLRGSVEEARRRLGDDRVTLAGPVEHRRVPAWLARAAVGVAPYPELDEFYFSPLKVVEYQAAGLPVVASRIGQLGELVEDGHTGRLLPPGDAEALARALIELHDNPAERRRMGRRARRLAYRRSGWSVVAERIEAIMRRCRQRRGRDPADGRLVAAGGGA